MTLETPLYQNTKGKWVIWEELTQEDKKEIKRKERVKNKSWLKKEVRENKPELVELLSKVTNTSKIATEQEIEKLLKEE